MKRELRLWIGQIIVPAVTLTATTIIAIPEAREAIARKFNNIKDSIKKNAKRRA